MRLHLCVQEGEKQPFKSLYRAPFGMLARVGQLVAYEDLGDIACASCHDSTRTMAPASLNRRKRKEKPRSRPSLPSAPKIVLRWPFASQGLPHSKPGRISLSDLPRRRAILILSCSRFPAPREGLSGNGSEDPVHREERASLNAAADDQGAGCPCSSSHSLSEDSPLVGIPLVPS